MSLSKAGLPKYEWSNWEYTFPHCTQDVHTDPDQVAKLVKWLGSKPHINRGTSAFQYDREGAMRMALMLGMLHHDLFIAQMGAGEEDDETLLNVPEFVGDSLIPFKTIDTHILPLCRDMTAGILAGPRTARTSARKPAPPISKEIKESVLPLPPKTGSGSKRARAGTDESTKGAKKETAKKVKK